MPTKTRLPAAYDWRILRALCLYRLILAPLLAGTVLLGLAPDFLELRYPPLFQALTYAWFGAGSLLMIAYALHRPPFAAQVVLHALSDLAFVSGVLIAGTGVDSGLGALLLIPTLGIGMLLPPRLAALAAAIGTLTLFAVELGVQLAQERWAAPPLTRTGLLGALLFVVAIAASTMSTRARHSEASAERAGSALDRLSASIAHEIRNPLSAIRQAADLLDEEPAAASPQAQTLRDMIRRHAARIDGIVHDVLEVGRGGAPETETQSLGALLHKARQQFVESGEATRLGIDIALPEAGEQPVIAFDTGHFCRIMHNLWRNSAEHGARGVVLSLLREGARLSLLVSDDGKGIDPALAEQIFEPFFTTRARGTGLGLYLARTLCEANHSALRLTDRGHGAHFMLHIPAPVSFRST